MDLISLRGSFPAGARPISKKAGGHLRSEEYSAMAVDIFSCGTCLKYFDLESTLKVGYRGTTNHIVEGMSDFQKVVWI